MAIQTISTIIGKFIKFAMRLRGGGSALPGLVVEKINPEYIERSLSKLPHGVVVISGTNGKTTTTKITVELLEAAGLKVFTNRTGSNFSRGVIAALLGEASLKGELDSDVAVLELDEAWAVKFTEQIKPKYSLILNVMKDQLDRFGEIDSTAKLLEKVAMSTTDHVVLNRDDPRLVSFAKSLNSKIDYFGVTQELLAAMTTDKITDHKKSAQQKADVLLKRAKNQQATYEIDGRDHTITLTLDGVYNLQNAAAALALARQIAPNTKTEIFLDALKNIEPAFGRGEIIKVDGKQINLILVKNPSGFRLALSSYLDADSQVAIAVNDNYADGRDISWLWDVDFSKLKNVSFVCGARANDMALRLAYDEVKIGRIEKDLEKSLNEIIENSREGQTILFFCTYTAMTKLRKLLSQKTKLEEIE